MNYFQNQERARRNTKRLVFLFMLAVFLIGCGLYLVINAVLYGAAIKSGSMHRGVAPVQFVWWRSELFAWTMLGTVAFIGLASLYRISTLKGGGAAVASMLGARAVDPGTKNPAERRLINVVEEMAIASGVPVPQVFIMDQEAGINAFAAGYSPNNAALTVTKGALEQLDRDQLQGVVAHEFSHILNGDMRLNIRLMGVLFGILAIAVIGRMVLFSARGRSSSRSNSGVAAFFLGLAMILIGYIGLIIGRLIQAAVSRQREFLADASAVQFTRNPAGIAGALAKIGGYEYGSFLRAPKTTEVAHFLFGEGHRPGLFSRMLASHPPLDERIKRIDPHFRPGESAVPSPEPPGAALSPAAVGFAGGSVRADPATVIHRVGRPQPRHMDIGQALRAHLGPAVLQAVRSGPGAAHLVHALLLDPDDAERARQLEALEGAPAPWDAEETLKLFQCLEDVGPGARLPLLDLAMPSLLGLPEAQKKAFLKQVETLIIADGKVSVFEYTIQWLVRERLLGKYGRPYRVLYKSVDRLAGNIVGLMTVLAVAGNPKDPNRAKRAFKAGMARLGLKRPLDVTFDARAGGSLDQVGEAIKRLTLASYPVRERVIDAAAHCVLEDGVVTIEEAELLRLVAVALDCPLPPFLAREAA